MKLNDAVHLIFFIIVVDDDGCKQELCPAADSITVIMKRPLTEDTVCL